MFTAQSVRAQKCDTSRPDKWRGGGEALCVLCIDTGAFELPALPLCSSQGILLFPCCESNLHCLGDIQEGLEE